MATFKIEPYLKNKKKNGDVPVIIFIIHQRKQRFIQTPIFINEKLISKKGEIKEKETKIVINDLYEKVNTILNELEFRVSLYSPDELKDYIVRKLEGKGKNIDFFQFSSEFLESIKDKQQGSYNNHTLAINVLKRFAGEPLPFHKITSQFMKKFHQWLIDEGGKDGAPLKERGQGLYLSSIRKIFNEAKAKYNDYDLGDIVIPNDPFKSFKVPKSNLSNTAEKKALDSIIIKNLVTYTPHGKLETLARDCFLLSFFLCGINSVDLYNLTDIEDYRIRYFRSKTKGRRKDNAEMVITIQPEIRDLYYKYKGEKKVFNFYEKYKSKTTFNMALNDGMKILFKNLIFYIIAKKEKTGITDIEKKFIEKFDYNKASFYMARHSFASIASNECKIPEEIIAMCLTHKSVNTMTSVYIKKDWSKIDNAVRQVVDLIYK